VDLSGDSHLTPHKIQSPGSFFSLPPPLQFALVFAWTHCRMSFSVSPVCRVGLCATILYVMIREVELVAGGQPTRCRKMKAVPSVIESQAVTGRGCSRGIAQRQEAAKRR
jgi:hypothetical protein